MIQMRIDIVGTGLSVGFEQCVGGGVRGLDMEVEGER